MPGTDEIIKLLQQYEALKTGESPWRSYNPNEGDRFNIDWDSLFPRVRARRQIQERIWDVEEDRWDPEWNHEFLDGLEEDLNLEEPSDDELDDIGKTMLWDICAWYQPIHFFAGNWGIYIREDCILRQARTICRFIPWPLRRRGSLPALAKCLVRASTYAFFLHEQYHHKIESLGLRLHVVDRKSCYLPYEANVYTPTKGTDAQLEEALANADSYQRLDTEPYRSWITYDIVKATWSYLEKRYPHDPPGYRMAVNYLKASSFEAGENILHGQVHEATLTPLQPPYEWSIATRLTQSLFKVTDNIWLLVKPGGRSILPARGKI